MTQTTVGPRFEDAMAYAARIHGDQTRKGGDIPYVAHLMAVASMALEYGADEDTAIAALLHDSLEDQPDKVSEEDIEARYGSKVLGIVKETGEADKSAPWRQRNQDYIDHLQHASSEAVLVSLCDKVHNAQSMARDYAKVGEGFWQRFNAGRDEQAWKYRELRRIYTERGAEPQLVEMLEDAMHRMGFT